MRSFNLNIDGTWRRIEITDEEEEKYLLEFRALQRKRFKSCMVDAAEIVKSQENTIPVATALFQGVASPFHYFLEVKALQKSKEKKKFKLPMKNGKQEIVEM